MTDSQIYGEVLDPQQQPVWDSYEHFNQEHANWYEQIGLGLPPFMAEIQATAESSLVPGIWLGTGSQAYIFDTWYANIYIDALSGPDDRDHDGFADDSLNGTDNLDIISSGAGQDWIQVAAGNDLVFAGSGDDHLFGGDGNDLLSGGSGNDEIHGGAGNDDIDGGAGSNTLDGGAGIDLVRLVNNHNGDLKFSRTETGYAVEYSDGATDILSNIERVDVVNHGLVALDVEDGGNAAEAISFIGVVAPALMEDRGVRGWVISRFDQGHSMEALCQVALDLHLLPTFSNRVLAQTVYHNVTGGDASESVIYQLENYIEKNGQGKFLAAAAELHLNVDLVGLQQTGLAYSKYYSYTDLFPESWKTANLYEIVGV